MNFKKLTSLLLTLVMVVSLMPMAAFAEEPSTETEPTSEPISVEQQQVEDNPTLISEPVKYDGTISVYYDSTSEDTDKTSDTGSIEISTMFPQGNTASYWVGFSEIGTVTYTDSSNIAVSENITNSSNGRYEIKIIGYGQSSYTFTITEGEGEAK
ncbi:MAG: hypothetical protein IJW74_02135, partial [Oscillospiraceae bacterium]|nr:hypothetical protein [Oscillospiraceae bacterium]